MKHLSCTGLLALALAAHANTGFTTWWPTFQAAVAGRGARTVAQGAEFPMHWENGPTRQIKTEAELVNRFDFYFTAEIRKAVATKRPEVLPNGIYIVTWKARGNEYSLYFKPHDSAFALDGLSEGPP